MLHNYKENPLLTVSYAHNIKSSNVDSVNLDEIVRRIQSDVNLEKAIMEIRHASDATTRTKLKTQLLPYFSFCSFKGNLRKNECFQSTWFFMFDADHVTDLVALRQRVIADPEIFLAFTSPSGDGLKFAIRLEREITDIDEYKRCYKVQMEELAQRFGIALDASTIDPARATFMSFDPDIYVNPGSVLSSVTLPTVPSSPEASSVAIPVESKKKTKLKSALQGTTTGNRHGELASIIGHLINKCIDEDVTLELMRGWNTLNTPPKEDQEILDTVRDLYERYDKKNPDTFADLCTNYWSLSSDYLEFGIKGGRFFMSSIGKEKFLTFAGAREKEEKAAAIAYLLEHKHISNIRLVRHISDMSAQETRYEVDVEAGEVTVRYAPVEVRVEDNQFIEEYLGMVFGEYKHFIKEYLAAYCYTNFRDLPTLVLKGARGSGKNTFAEMVYAIFPALSQTWEAKKGSFTPEAEMKLLMADETFCDSKEVYQLLKQYAGAKYAQVNKKFQIPYDVENNMNIIIMSNAAIPIYVAKSEKPTSEANNQFFVYEFKPFTGAIDPELDKKLEERIGHYVRTELKTVFDGIDFTGNRYSIKTPITPEEEGLFESNTTEEESVTERIIDAIADKASEARFAQGYRELMEANRIPTELIKHEASLTRASLQAVIKELQSQGYLEMGESKKFTIKGTGTRTRCHQMTEKFRREIHFYEVPSAPSSAQTLF